MPCDPKNDPGSCWLELSAMNDPGRSYSPLDEDSMTPFSLKTPNLEWSPGYRKSKSKTDLFLIVSFSCESFTIIEVVDLMRVSVS